VRYRRPRTFLLVLMLAIVGSGSGALAGPVSAAQFHFSPLTWLKAAADGLNAVGGQSLVNAVFGASAISGGSDGRITVMLVGSDYRAHVAGTGERLDSIMFMTIDNSHHISAISLPRDVGNVPIGPGEVFKGKINGIFKHYKQIYGSRNVALEHVRTAFQYAFQIQIDYVAFVRFTGFDRLVKNVGGVPVTVPTTIYDSGIYDTRPVKQKGAKFLSGNWTEQDSSSAPLCYTVGSPINWNASPNCTYALLYVRSRHGPGNNDWKRAKRQQNFVFDAIRRVLSRGSGSNLQSLRTSTFTNPDDFYTTLPLGTSDVVDMYNKVSGASLSNQAVLQPPTYASNVPGTSKQQLKIDVVRSLFHSWFGPLN
jgi:anionic cell wall polymer biosynthesis LytR-Cps2A-Psr (LCP) family protein